MQIKDLQTVANEIKHCYGDGCLRSITRSVDEIQTEQLSKEEIGLHLADIILAVSVVANEHNINLEEYLSNVV